MQNDQLMPRLVGALILICFTVVLWPLIFDAVEPTEKFDSLTQVPEAPSFPSFEIDETKAEDALANVRSTKAMSADHSAQQTADTAQPVERQSLPEKPKLDLNKLPKAWSVQVASLSSREGASILVKKLQDKKMQAYQRKIQGQSKPIYRVFVGPYMKEAKAKSVIVRLDKELGLKALLIRYRP